MKKLSWLLILIGICLFSYPFLESAYTWYLQEQLTRSFEEGLQSSSQETLAEYEGLQSIFEAQTPEDEEVNGEGVDEAAVTSEQAPEPGPAPTVLGLIKIEKINLSMPVLEGATERNLNRGAALVTGTSPLGEAGNAAIAGHRGYSRGRFFNRLDELEIGDRIVIETKSRQYEYEVYEILVVEPDDVSVLSRNDQDEIITLITCTPLYTSTHRLIVHARRSPAL